MSSYSYQNNCLLFYRNKFQSPVFHLRILLSSYNAHSHKVTKGYRCSILCFATNRMDITSRELSIFRISAFLNVGSALADSVQVFTLPVLLPASAGLYSTWGWPGIAGGLEEESAGIGPRALGWTLGGLSCQTRLIHFKQQGESNTAFKIGS